MPTSKSAKKRVRTAQRSAASNKATRAEIMTAGKSVKNAQAAGDADAVKKATSRYFSLLDKAVKRGTMKPNTAARRKSRVTARPAASK